MPTVAGGMNAIQFHDDGSMTGGDGPHTSGPMKAPTQSAQQSNLKSHLNMQRLCGVLT
jgi:hypothetical protein